MAAYENSEGNMQEMFFDVIGRVRALEGKYNLLRDRALMINQNMIDSIQRNNGEFVSLNDDVKQIKHDIFELKETIRHLVEELGNFSRKEDVKVLEKYINLWNPLKFVTEDDVRKIIKEEEKENKVKKIGGRTKSK
jgi:hypothetical protein